MAFNEGTLFDYDEATEELYRREADVVIDAILNENGGRGLQFTDFDDVRAPTPVATAAVASPARHLTPRYSPVQALGSPQSASPQQSASPARSSPEQPPPQRRRAGEKRRRVRTKNGAYDYNFVNRLPNVSPNAREQVKRMRLNLRKQWLERYFQRRGRPRPPEMNTPPASPPPAAQAQRCFVQAALRTPPRPTLVPCTPPRPLLVEPPPPPTPSYAPIPFPELHLNEDELADIDNINHDLPPARAIDFVEDGAANRYPDLQGDLEGMDVLFQQREEDRLKNEARSILDAYCASTKSNMDVRIFNRDYLRCIARTTNTVL
eukprot:Seg1915.4 transcript_id=Seg1915.4/GoldUCD/mRNA.D3Y31 product="hypothetical protein" protein_id=Seg1915.4/GoldUCD/D3Y31